MTEYRPAAADWASYVTAYSLAADPMFDGIRAQPRFQAVLRAMGLPPSAINTR